MKEAPRRMIKEKSMNIILSEMVGISFVLDEASNYVDWREAMVVDLVSKTKPTPGGRSTFVAKRDY